MQNITTCFDAILNAGNNFELLGALWTLILPVTLVGLAFRSDNNSQDDSGEEEQSSNNESNDQGEGELLKEDAEATPGKDEELQNQGGLSDIIERLLSGDVTSVSLSKDGKDSDSADAQDGANARLRNQGEGFCDALERRLKACERIDNQPDDDVDTTHAWRTIARKMTKWACKTLNVPFLGFDLKNLDLNPTDVCDSPFYDDDPDPNDLNDDLDEDEEQIDVDEEEREARLLREYVLSAYAADDVTTTDSDFDDESESEEFKEFKAALIALFPELLNNPGAIEQNLEHFVEIGYTGRLQNYLFLGRFYTRSAWLCQRDAYDLGVSLLQSARAVMRAMNEEFSDCFDELDSSNLSVHTQLMFADYGLKHGDEVSCLNHAENAIERARKRYEESPDDKTARLLYARALRIYCIALLRTQRHSQLKSALNEYKTLLLEMTVDQDGLDQILGSATVLAHLYPPTGDVDSAIEVCRVTYELLEAEQVRSSMHKRFFVDAYFPFIRSYCIALMGAERVEDALPLVDSTFDFMARYFSNRERASDVEAIKGIYELKTQLYAAANRMPEATETRREFVEWLEHVYQTFPNANKSYTLLSTLIGYCLNELKIKFALQAKDDCAVALDKAITYVSALDLTDEKHEANTFLWRVALLNFLYDWSIQFDSDGPLERIQSLLARSYERIDPRGDEDYENLRELILVHDAERAESRAAELTELGRRQLAERTIDATVRLFEILASDGNLEYTRALKNAHVLRAHYQMTTSDDGVQKAEKDLQVAWSLSEDISDIESDNDDDYGVSVMTLLLLATGAAQQDQYDDAFRWFKKGFAIARQASRRYDYAGRDFLYGLFNCYFGLIAIKDTSWRWQWCAMVLRYLERYHARVRQAKELGQITEEQFKWRVTYFFRTLFAVKSYRLSLDKFEQSDFESQFKLEKACHFSRFTQFEMMDQHEPNGLSAAAGPCDFAQLSEQISRCEQKCEDPYDRMRLVDLVDLIVIAGLEDFIAAYAEERSNYIRLLGESLHRLVDVDSARQIAFYFADLGTALLAERSEDFNIAYEKFDLSTPEKRAEAIVTLANLDAQIKPEEEDEASDDDSSVQEPEVVLVAFDLLENQTNALMIDCDLREDQEFCAITPGATPQVDPDNARFLHGIVTERSDEKIASYPYLSRLFLKGENLPQPRLSAQPSEELQTLRARVEVSFRLRILMLKRGCFQAKREEFLPLYSRAISQFAEWLCSQGRIVEAFDMVVEQVNLLKESSMTDSVSGLRAMSELLAVCYVIPGSFPHDEMFVQAIQALSMINQLASALNLLDVNVAKSERGQEVIFLYEYAARVNLELFQLSKKDESAVDFFINAYRYSLACAQAFERTDYLLAFAQLFVDAFKNPEKPTISYRCLGTVFESFFPVFFQTLDLVQYDKSADKSKLAFLLLTMLSGANYHGWACSCIHRAISRLKTLSYAEEENVYFHCGEYIEELANAMSYSVGLADLYNVGNLRAQIVRHMRHMYESLPRPDAPGQVDKYENTRSEALLLADFYDLVDACENRTDEEIYIAVDRYRKTLASVCDFDPTPLFRAYADALGKSVNEGITGRIFAPIKSLKLAVRFAMAPTLKELAKKWRALPRRVQNFVLIAQFLPILTLQLERKLRNDQVDALRIPKSLDSQEEQTLEFRSSFHALQSDEPAEYFEYLVNLVNVASRLTTVDNLFFRACNLAVTKSIRDFRLYYLGNDIDEESDPGAPTIKFGTDVSHLILRAIDPFSETNSHMKEAPRACLKSWFDAWQNDCIVVGYCLGFVSSDLSPQMYATPRRLLENAFFNEKCFFLRPQYINLSTVELRAQLKDCLARGSVTQEEVSSFVSVLARLREMARKLVARGISAKILISADAVGKELDDLLQQVQNLPLTTKCDDFELDDDANA